MKKILLSLLAGIPMLLGSCGKESAEDFAPTGGETTFSISVADLQTRATTPITPTRYVMEVYDATGTTPQEVIKNADGTLVSHCEIGSGTFSAYLDKNKAYTCLFWADGSAAGTQSGVYDAASLKTVKLNTDKVATEAYYAKVDVAEGKNPAVSVTLKRAVAKITLVETAAVEVGKQISVTYDNNTSFNALDSTADTLTTDYTSTITTVADKLTGTLGEFYMLSSAGGATLDISIRYDAEDAKSLTNVPVKQNYNTNIKGEFSNLVSKTFTVTADDAWDATENEVDKDALPATKTITIDGVAFDFVLVKAGTFRMGTPGATDTERPCWVQITKDYYIGKTEVTQAQYEKIMGSNPSGFNGSTGKEPATGETQANRPVETVSWTDLNTATTGFLARMNAKTAVSAAGTVRLPSEAQWEYAARGGHKAGAFMQWPGTNTVGKLEDYAWLYTYTASKTHEVGKKKPNLLGLYDMAGNVMEWCSSYYTGNYPTGTTEGAPAVDPDENTTGTYRVLRGGDYGDDTSFCRSAFRYSRAPGFSSLIIGFRLVLVPPSSTATL